MARDEPPDLVISDLLMPGMDGYLLCRQWVADPALRHIPFVVYSATFVEPSDEQLALDLGAARFLVKPLGPEALWAALDDLLAASERGALEPGAVRLADELEFLRAHDERLAQKLVSKLRDLELLHDQLARAEKHFRSLVENSGDGSWLLRPDGTIVYASPANERILGDNANARVGRSVLEQTHPEDRERLGATLARAAGETPSIERERIRHLHQDGSWRWLELTLSNLLDHAVVRAVLVTMRDITSDVETAERLRRAETRYRNLVQHAAYGIFLATASGQLVEVNPALVQMLGYDTEQELLSIDMARDLYKNPDEREALVTRLRIEKRLDGVEVLWRRRDGTELIVRASTRIVPSSEGYEELFETLVEDVTAQRELESNLRQAQKMDAVGRLAGGVAHDFNNLLTVIGGSAAMLIEELASDDPRREHVTEIAAASERARQLTAQLLMFGRKELARPRVVDLAETVGASLGMLKRLVGERYQLVLEIAPGSWTVRADTNQIEHVLLNLVQNAHDAMPAGGTIEIEIAGSTATKEKAAGASAAAPGEHVVLRVRDHGCGFDDAIRARLFEPFFTTKESGKGTGLGLATVYAIARQHDAVILVESEPGLGATFEVLFRPSTEAPSTRPEAIDRELARGTESVLVVEDEAATRRVVVAMLERAGYRVTSTGSSREALANFGDGSQFDLVLTDVVMPGLSGPELMDELIEIRHDLKFLFISGYASDSERENPLLQSERLLQKPFDAATLTHFVRRALDA